MIEQAEEQDGPGEEVSSGMGYFILNLLQVDRMVRQDPGAEEARIPSASMRHVGPAQRNNNPRVINVQVSTRSGMTYYKAEQALHSGICCYQLIR